MRLLFVLFVTVALFGCGDGATTATDPDDGTPDVGPVNPIPAGLWQPAAGATPATGDYVYLASDAGEYVGQGQTQTHTDAITISTFAAEAGYVRIEITAWNGHFQAMAGLATLEVGYYPDLERYPFHDTTKGGLSWSGFSRGCNELTGWFVVDAVTYSGTTPTAIDLRFEQHCDGQIPALHGAIHWTG